jgi:hypothetical protein
MEHINLVIVVFGVLMGAVGYFLKKTMEDIKDLQISELNMKIKLEVLENDHINKHTHMNEKFDELNKVMVDLTKELKNLNIELLKKKF